MLHEGPLEPIPTTVPYNKAVPTTRERLESEREFLRNRLDAVERLLHQLDNNIDLETFIDTLREVGL